MFISILHVPEVSIGFNLRRFTLPLCFSKVTSSGVAVEIGGIVELEDRYIIFMHYSIIIIIFMTMPGIKMNKYDFNSIDEIF